VVKYDPSGNTVWVASFVDGSFYFGLFTGLAVKRGHAYLCGSNKDRGFEVMRVTSNGQLEWIQNFGLFDSADVVGLAVASDGAVYATGGRVYKYPEVTFVTYKVDESGNPMWEANYNNYSAPQYHAATSMVVDADDNVYVTGLSQNFAVGVDWATVKYAPDGKEQWAVRENGPTDGVDLPYAIAVDNSGHVYVAGSQEATNGLIKLTELVVIKYSELKNIRLQSDRRVALQYFATPGLFYRFQGSTNLLNWSDVGSSVADADGIVRFTNVIVPPFPSRFFRAVHP
jgi:hypothetical protein